jgi:hypothetical protein
MLTQEDVDVLFFEKVSSGEVFHVCCSFFNAFFGSQLLIVASMYMCAIMSEKSKQKNRFCSENAGGEVEGPFLRLGL